MTITPEQIENSARNGQQLRADTMMEIAARLRAAESPRGVINEDLIKRILRGIDETEIEAEEGWWETSTGAAFGAAKQAELIAALTQQTEPVAVGGSAVHQIQGAIKTEWLDVTKSFFDNYSAAPKRTIYTAPAPASGVREGMLRAVEICKNLAQLCDPSEKARGLKNAATVIEAEAITRAADQVNAEDYSKVPMGPVGATYVGDQVKQDAVSVPLAKKHENMRVSLNGMLGRIARGSAVEDHHRYAIGEFLKHCEEMAKRFYSGNMYVIDEFLQLYCLDEHRPNGRAAQEAKK